MSNEQLQRRFRNLLLKGTRALQAGEMETAVRLLERAHKLIPHQVEAQLNLGGAYILTKQFKQAAAILGTAALLEPENAMIWTNLGAAYLGNPILAKEEEQQRAIEAFERALTLNPVAPNVAYNIGLIYRDKQEHRTALQWFQRAVQTNPQDKDARFYVAKMEEKVQG